MRIFNTLILALFISATAFAQNVNITFELNVATLGSNVAASGMYIGGGSGFGGPTDNPMTDAGNGIWTITFSQPAGFSSHYTFLNGDGGWSAKENIGGLPCADPANFNDRFLPPVMQDTVVKACFGTCDSDGTCTIVTDSVNITFMVNTSSIMVDPTGIFLAGGGNFGSPGDNPMSDADGNGVYEFTTRQAKGFTSYYTFTNGNSGWGAKEDISGLPCAQPANFNDRLLPAVFSDTTLMTCFGTCSPDTSCSAPPPMMMNPDLPITFEDTMNINYNIVDFGGNSGSMVVVDPTDPNNLVVQSTKDAGAQTWAGTTLGDGGLANPIPFTATDQKMSVRVWSPTAGTTIMLKVEYTGDGSIFAEAQATTTMASMWETLEFDFSMPTNGTLDLANTYDKVVIFYDFGNSPMAAATYYCDDVMFVAPPVAQTKPSLPITFEDTVTIDHNFADFGGTYASPTMVVVDPTNPNNLVAKTTKPSGSQTWAGTVIGDAGLTSAIPFTASNQKMYVDVWAPNAGTPILLKVENSNDGNIAAEVQVSTTVGSAWETLEFDLSQATVGSIDLNNTYDKVVIFYNFGTAGADVTYYCDNVAYGSPFTSTRGIEVDANLFTIQPNLVRDFVNITFGENAINTQKQLTVVNAIGQTIETRTIDNDEIYKLDASNYANGLYFLSIRTENAMFTKRFVVNK